MAVYLKIYHNLNCVGKKEVWVANGPNLEDMKGDQKEDEANKNMLVEKDSKRPEINMMTKMKMKMKMKCINIH